MVFSTPLSGISCARCAIAPPGAIAEAAAAVASFDHDTTIARARGMTATVLFIQATEPGAYPPLINAAWLFAEAGWFVHFLGAPIAGRQLELPSHPRIARTDIQIRPTHVMTKLAYATYCARATALARKLHPAVIYASDPIGALPGLLAARAGGGRLVYHEHDSPNRQEDLNRVLAWARRKAVRTAHVIVFPNSDRAKTARHELNFAADRLHTVWNVPRRDEMPASSPRTAHPLVVYYHGTIVPDRLPAAVPKALREMRQPVILRIAGYETESGVGLITELETEFGRASEGGLIEFIGQISRADLLRSAVAADVGLALMPMSGGDINMQHMTGASNKVFDYMAAGLPLIVSDLPDWRAVFVDPGHAVAVNPNDPRSIAAALRTLLENPALRTDMGRRSRDRIAAVWNYEMEFSPVIRALEGH